MSNYKFYLAFENLAVEDYVSEKVFEGLLAGTVPVYRGTSAIHRFLPGNSSIIDANNLSPKDLADQLKRIGNDESEYKRFLKFKETGVRKEFEEVALRSYIHPNVLCRLCGYGLLARDSIDNP